ncbi:MAG TPA: hypothetical protein VGF45_04220 [Polyangia bacterium]
MPLDLHQTRLYARQIALPSVGPEGQERLARASVVIFAERDARATGDTVAADSTALYLRAAGVGAVTVAEIPLDERGFAEALQGAQLAIRFAFDDDALMDAVTEAGLPLVVGRINQDVIELLSLRQQRPCRHPSASPDAPVPASLPLHPVRRAARDPAPGAAAVVAATLAATEALFVLLERDRQPTGQLLRLPLSGGEPTTVAIPWPPSCPLCEGPRPKVNLS